MDNFGEKAKLTDKDKAFCQHYVTTWNKTQSAIAAGFSVRSAGALGVKMYNRPEIKEYLKQIIEEVLPNYSEIIMEDVQFWQSIVRNPEEKTQDRLKASEHLGKYAKMFTDSIDLSISTIDKDGNKSGISFV